MKSKSYKRPGAKKFFNNRRYRVKKVRRLNLLKNKFYVQKDKENNKW